MYYILCRTEDLGCSGDVDFLAKLYCVRLAFDELTLSQANREYFHKIGRDLMSSFLSSTGHVRIIIYCSSCFIVSGINCRTLPYSVRDLII